MKTGLTHRFVRWVAVGLLALTPTAAVHAEHGTNPPATTGTTKTGQTTGPGLFGISFLSAGEQTQLMTEAGTLADDLFGLLGVTPTAAERAGVVKLLYWLLLILTLFQKLSAQSPSAP